MSELISRAFSADLEVRADGTGRTLHGIVVPFGVVARVSDGGRPYDEMFRMGSFAKTIQERGARVKLLSQHDSRANPLGRASLLREDAAGLYGEFTVSRTTAGDEALELVRDGALDSFSVGFTPIRHVMERGVKVRTEVGLREASLVTFPAYADALVGGVRAEDMTDEQVRALAQRLLSQISSSTPEGEPLDATTAPAAGHPDEEPLSPALRAETPEQRVKRVLLSLRTRGAAS